MIRLSYFIRKRADLSDGDFRALWLERHAALVAGRASALRIRRHVQSLVLPEDPVAQMLQQIYATGGQPYDGVAHFWWKSAEDLEEALTTAEGRQAADALAEDERGFVDFSRSLLGFGMELPQINPPEDIVAKEGTTILKGYYVGNVRSGLSLQAAKFHWITCHGPLAREYQQFLPYRRYIQVHALGLPLAARMREARKGMPEAPSFIGHAEVWADRRDLALATGPEVGQAFQLLSADIHTFVDSAAASVFVAKEYVVVDKPIMVPPLPQPAAHTNLPST